MTRTRRPPPALGDTFDLLAPLTPEAAITASGAEGHRDRMRARLLTAGPEALADHEMLEMVLFLALPRRDTKPLARALARPLPQLRRRDRRAGRRICSPSTAWARPAWPP